MIAIIGAGPVGCYAAALLADNHEVKVFEEHKSVGLPVQCTGIVTQEIFNFVPKKNNFVINQVNDVRIFAPNNKHLRLKLKNPDIVINRQKFDNYFYNMARKKGAEFFFNHRFISVKDNHLQIMNLKSKKIKKFRFSYLIGADGPRSPVAQESNLSARKKYFIGMQAIIKKKNNSIIDFYPFKQGFGWAVPEDNNTLRIGAASRVNTKEHFNKLLRKYKGKIISKQAGLIPVFNPWLSFRKEKVFLTGDAAGFVKATTGGGLVSGLKSAEILAHSINHNLSYEFGIYLHLFPSLWMNRKMRMIMDSFSKQDWNQLIKDLNNKKSKNALQNVNRDKLFQLLLSLAVNNPGVLSHAARHFKALF